MEVWKSIPRYNGMYEVSNHGRIRSWIRHRGHKGKRKVPKIMNPGSMKTGHRTISLYKGRIPYTRLVHRLVGRVFIPNPENKPCINHIDGNPSNNHVSNLEWCTVAENAQHENAGNSKLTSNDIQKIRMRYKNESIFQHELADEYGVGQDQISRIVNKKRWANIKLMEA